MSVLKSEEAKYVKMVYPKGMAKQQSLEIAMAFNAGALSTFTIIAELCKNPNNDESCKAIGKLKREIEARCAELCAFPKANPGN